jgi:hypothetical protein
MTKDLTRVSSRKTVIKGVSWDMPGVKDIWKDWKNPLGLVQAKLMDTQSDKDQLITLSQEERMVDSSITFVNNLCLSQLHSEAYWTMLNRTEAHRELMMHPVWILKLNLRLSGISQGIWLERKWVGQKRTKLHEDNSDHFYMLWWRVLTWCFEIQSHRFVWDKKKIGGSCGFIIPSSHHKTV